MGGKRNNSSEYWGVLGVGLFHRIHITALQGMCHIRTLGEIWDKDVTVFFYLQLCKDKACIYNPSSLPWDPSGILGKQGELLNVAVLLRQGQRCRGSQVAGASFLLAPGSSTGSLSCQLPALGKWVPRGALNKGPSCLWQMVKAPASQQHWEHHWSEECCCLHSRAGRKNPVSKSWPHRCKVCLCSLPLSVLELTHHWPYVPAKLGALALSVPWNILSWFLHTCFSLCNMRAVRHMPQEHCDAELILIKCFASIMKCSAKVQSISSILAPNLLSLNGSCHYH